MYVCKIKFVTSQITNVTQLEIKCSKTQIKKNVSRAWTLKKFTRLYKN